MWTVIPCSQPSTPICETQSEPLLDPEDMEDPPVNFGIP